MPINFYAVLGPAILLIVVIEFIYCLYVKNGFYEFQDSMSSLGTAIINQCMNLFVAFLVLIPFTWIYQKASFSHHEANWMTYTLGLIGVDFLFYWFHRMGHSINILWAAHMPHHSTEELNYAVGLRSSLTQRLASFLFYWPMLLVGISPGLLTEIVALHLLYQFLGHTRVVPKLPSFIENIFNTPSHHRVHHGLNKQYINKNYAGMFIIWDKLFGTWEAEVEEVFYGCNRPSLTWDPTKINIQWWVYLWNDAVETPKVIDKIKVWFMPLGWRPPGVSPLEERKQLTKETQVKFQTKAYKSSYAYIIIQLLIGMIFMFFVIGDKSPLSSLEKTIMALNFWMMATVWGGFLESKKWSIPLELIRVITLPIFLLNIASKYDLQLWFLSTPFLIGVGIICSFYVLVIKFNNTSENRSLATAF
ncbi:MAG: sterol desaturase family protein [Bacteriovoracaceae bacterium]|jgi:alkylglycerol monooxygenase|nr:sterol desaturase family protein [Bacteriovoracaceae bacterium]